MDASDVFNAIRHRRTVREFKSTPVPENDIRKILDAARYAPTCGNIQPWKFVVIRDPDRFDSLEILLKNRWEQTIRNQTKLSEQDRNMYIENGKKAIEKVLTAPVYIFTFVDTSVYADYAMHDGSLAVGMMMIMARALGYGTGYFTTYFPEDVIKPFVNAPDKYRLICSSPIGIPKEWPETPPKKNLDEFIIHESFEK